MADDEGLLMGANGENNREEMMEAERRASEQRNMENLIACLLILAAALLLLHGAWWVILGHAVLFQNIYTDSELPRYIPLSLLLGTLIPPIIHIIVYSMYQAIETEAFNQFETMYPPFEDGQGDLRRLEHFTWKKMRKKLWIQRKYIKELIKDNIKSILLFIFGLILICDVGYKINELHLIYSKLPFSYKFLIIGPIVLVAHECKYIPTYLSHYIMLDTLYLETFLPVVYKTTEPVSTFSLILWIPRIIGLWYLYKKSKESDSQNIRMPNIENAFRIVAGRIGDDLHAQMLATLVLFARWLEITEQEERSNTMGIHFLPQLADQLD